MKPEDQQAFTADMADHQFTIGDWDYYATNHHDEDLARDLSHMVVNSKTGQLVDIEYQRSLFMSRNELSRLILMGFPTPHGPKWSMSTVNAAFDQHVLLRAAGLSWDIEVA